MSRVIINPYRFAAAAGSISFVRGVQQGSTDTNGFTTPGIDTTGANFVIVGAVWSAFVTEPTMADNQGNSYGSAVAVYGNASSVVKVGFWYIPGALVGSSHTWTITRNSSFPTVSAAAFSSVKTSSPLDSETGTSGTGLTAITPGSRTASVSNSLYITMLGLQSGMGGVTPAITASYNRIGTFIDADGVNHFGGYMAYIVGSGALNPQWSWTLGVNTASNHAVFQPA